ncbi:Protein of unknown function (DUF1566) [Thioflavicoccus mobilis 8321]|uniref:Lcl C-terminal domain-containing protein n=1 Tax=Thioflavicoccus mobilis 8321 TaxID=765912 RepID=L0H2L2_9GAMM|nr:DUF1566 domain-containing protein [Thioflavicoccus mobilis]AGA92297.1 Protein of unknown function (DUF1566) [Thioflavicoccus mobilis 8321]
MPLRSRTLTMGTCLALSLLVTGGAGAQTERPCEHDARASGTAERFVDLGDGTLLDKARGLEWKRCSEGQEWVADAGTCRGWAAVYNWPEALAYAEEVRFAGHQDWRVPTREELHSIVVPGCTAPAIDLGQFPATPAFAYWSATPFEYFDRLAWAVYFKSGETGYSPRDYGYFHVRLVRDAQESGTSGEGDRQP